VSVPCGPTNSTEGTAINLPTGFHEILHVYGRAGSQGGACATADTDRGAPRSCVPMTGRKRSISR